MQHMDKTEQMIEMWLDGTVLYGDLPEAVQKQVDAMIDGPLEKGDPTSSDVHYETIMGGRKGKQIPLDEELYSRVKAAAKKKFDVYPSAVANGWVVQEYKRRGGEYKTEKAAETEDVPLVHKSQNEHMFTMGPWYIPNKADAHDEWTDADELQKALWDYVRSGDRNIRLQHNRDIVAGEWLEAMSFPIPITMRMNKSDGSQNEVTYPEGTVFLGVQWKPWAWDMVKAGKITGFSIGGAAARVEMGLPADMEKRGFGGNRSAAGAYAAEQRWRKAGGMDYPDKERLLSQTTRTMFVNGKERTFNTATGNAVDVKTGDVISSTGGTDPMQVVGRVTTDAKIGGSPTIGFIVHPLGQEKQRATMVMSAKSKVTLYTEVQKGAGSVIVITSPSGDVAYRIVPVDTYVGKSQIRNVAGLYGPNGEVGMVRTDGERYWAYGHSTLENLDHAIAQQLFKQVDLEVEKAKKGTSFGGNRSQAGRYAANVRWGNKMREASGVADGTAPKPTTPGGAALGYSKSGAPSLVTHCDLDAVHADMQAAGLKEPTPDMYYKHLTPERRAEWDAAIAEKVNSVPTNPDGPNAYMMGGGAASGKSSAIKDKAVNVPNADPKEGAVKAVDVNPDSAKAQMASYNNMVANKDMRAASFAHEESSQIAALTGAAGLKKGSDIVVDGVANNGAAKTIGKTDTYRALGAKRVELHVVTVEIGTAASRNVARAKKTGRKVDPNALVHGHKGVSKNFPEYAKSGKWDVVTVTDTNGSGARKIFEQRAGGRARVIDQGLFDQFLAKADYKG